jgi:hypothetical protein
MSVNRTSIGIIVAVVAVALAGSTALGLLSFSKTLSNTGNVKAVGVGVYKDIGCSQVLSSIDWGSLAPGSSSNYTAYIRNEGTVAVSLAKTTGNWNPTTAAGNMTLSWNRGGYILSSNAVVQATLTLSVSSSVTGISSFSFDITITGTET